jgi:hypothetical protein
MDEKLSTIAEIRGREGEKVGHFLKPSNSSTKQSQYH